MGGKGSGGTRVGAGKKPKTQRLGAIQGSRRTRARARARNQNPGPPNQNAAANQNSGPDAPVVAAHIPPPPGNLTLDELAVWNELAPLAYLEGTLTDATAVSFRDLCELVILKRKLLREVIDDGVTVATLTGGRKAHPLLTQFRGLTQRVEAFMLRFKLSPMGKEILPPAGDQPVDPFAEFGHAVPTDKPGATH